MEMVLAYWEDRVPSAEGIMDIIDFIHFRFGDPINNYNGTGTNATKLLAVAREFAGFTKSFKTQRWGINQIKQQIDLGRPVVASVYCKYLPTRIYKYSWDHVVVVVGYDDHDIICNDPNMPSLLQERYPISDFSKAFAKQGGQAVVVVP